MSRTTSSLIAALALLAAPLAAQSKSAGATATLTVAANLSLAKTQDMSFGTHFAGDGPVTSNSNTAAQWQGATDVGNSISFSFALPATLDKDASHHVAFSCGTTAASWHNGNGIGGSFNPSTGLPASPAIEGDGSFVISLGAGPGNDSQACSVNVVTGTTAGVYQGTITLTVAVL